MRRRPRLYRSFKVGITIVFRRFRMKAFLELWKLIQVNKSTAYILRMSIIHGDFQLSELVSIFLSFENSGNTVARWV